jgi:hypothetical protein
MNRNEPPALPRDIQALLDVERASTDDYSALKSVVRSQIAARLAATTPAKPPAPRGGGAPSPTMVGKLLVPALTFAMGVGTGVISQKHLEPTPVVQAAPLSVPVTAPVTPNPPPVAPVDAPVPPAPRKLQLRPKPEAVAPVADTSLAAENAILERARVALGRGEGGLALVAIDAHRRDFPRGRLAEEREALRVQALAGSGRTAEAKATAVAFHKDFPDSLFGAAVDAATQN